MSKQKHDCGRRKRQAVSDRPGPITVADIDRYVSALVRRGLVSRQVIDAYRSPGGRR